MIEPSFPIEPAPDAAGSRRWLALGIALGAAAIAGLIVAADGKTLLRLATGIDPRSLLWPAFCTLVSYAAMAASYWRIAAVAGLDLPFGEMLRITLVSTSANYLLSTGGLSGVAVRSYYFSQQHRLSPGAAVSISLAQAFNTNLVFFAFLFWGMLNVLFYENVGGRELAVVGIFFVLSLGLCLLALSIVAWRPARQWLFALLLKLPNWLAHVFPSRRERLRAKLTLFEDELHEGVDFLIANGSRMIVPLALIFADWFLMLATLYAAFRCVGQVVPMHVVVIGFSAGVFLSLVNLVPAGLGIMEGSMAAVFAGLGVPLESAIIATVIFRVSYYVLPLLVTLVFLRRMFFSARISQLENPATR